MGTFSHYIIYDEQQEQSHMWNKTITHDDEQDSSWGIEIKVNEAIEKNFACRQKYSVGLKYLQINNQYRVHLNMPLIMRSTYLYYVIKKLLRTRAISF